MTIRENYAALKEFVAAHNGTEEMLAFIDTRIAQEDKAREAAKAKRIEKNGGEKRDVSQSDFYVALRNQIYPKLTTEFQTGDALVAGEQTPAGKTYLAAQVATALKPLIADGTVISDKVKVAYVDKNGLNKESMRTAYKLA
jgi:hypothetical protein